MRRFGNCECGQPALAAYSAKPVCPDCAAEGYGEPEPRPAPKADGLVEEAAGLFARLDGHMNADETELVDTILAALSDRDVVLEEALKTIRQTVENAANFVKADTKRSPFTAALDDIYVIADKALKERV